MSEIIEKHKYYLVKSEYGTYTFNNRKTAEQLSKHLTQYEKISKTSKETEKTLDRVTKGVIQLQISVKILEHEINTLQKVVQKCKSE